MNVKDVNESSFPEGTFTSPNFVNEFSEPITLKEVKTGIKTLKNNTSTSVGYDCMGNEMLKYSSSSMIECICKLLSLDVTLLTGLKALQNNYLSQDVPSNYRGISISSCLHKLLS